MANKQTDNDKRIIGTVSDCVDKIASGMSLNDCIKLHPELEKDEIQHITSMLEVASIANRAYPESREAIPTKQYMQTGKGQLLAALGDIKEKPAKLEPRFTGYTRNIFMFVSAAAAAIVILAGGLVNYSSDSLPGSAFYAVKRMSETARLALTFNETDKARLHYKLAQTRAEEVNLLMKTGDDSGVGNAYKEAKENLSEASKIAKKTPDRNGTDLKSNIDDLNETLKEQSTRIASRVESNNKKSGSLKTGDDASEKEKSNRIASNSALLNGQEANASGDKDANGGSVLIKEEVAVNIAEPDQLKNQEAEKKDTEFKNESSKSLNHDNRQRNAVVSDENNSEVQDTKASASIVPFEVNTINVSDQSFSPNGDGVKDMVTVHVKGATTEGFTVDVYQSTTKVKTLSEQSSGKDADIFWNGSGQNGDRLPDGEYTLKVSNLLGQVAHNKAKVVIDTKAPRIGVVGPPNGIKTDNQTPQFIWRDSEGIDKYYLHIAPDSGSTENKRTVTNITNNFYEPLEKLSPGLWTWRVIAIDEAGNVGVSPYSELTIELPKQPDKKVEALR